MEPRKSVYRAVRLAMPGLVAVAMLASVMGGCDLGTGLPVDNTGGTPTANTAPVLTFTKPNTDTTVYIGQALQIAWVVADAEDQTTVKIYYDRDGLKASGDEVLLTQAQKNPNDFSVSTFSWDTTNLTPGTYHILASVDDGHNAVATLYNNAIVTVAVSTPSITLTEPFGPRSVDPAQNLVIKWTQDSPLASSKVTLFYDKDQDYTNGTSGTITTLTEPAASSTDYTYTWNVPAVQSGQYYLGAVLDDGTHPAVVAYANGSVSIGGPSVQIFNPSTDQQWNSGGTVAIRYQVDSKRAGTVRLFYDKDGVGTSGDEVLLVTQPIQAGAVTWTWSGATLAKGTYYIGAEVNDGVNTPVVAYAQGLVRELGPSVTVSAPTGVTAWHSGGTVVVTFTAKAFTGTAKVFYDVDGIAGTADDVVVSPALTFVNGVSQSWTWNSAALPHGTYHVGVKVDDGKNPVVTAYAAGTITDNGPTLQITAPAAAVTVNGGAVVPITFNYQSDGVAPTVRLFYDTNTTYDAVTDNPRTIAPTPKLEPKGTGTDTINWTVPLLTAGTYHIGAVMTAGADTVVVYVGTNVDVLGPSLSLTQPGADIKVLPGGTVTIAWSNQLPGVAPKLDLFYDTDQNLANGTSGAIVANLAVNPALVGGTYTWNVPGNLANPPAPLVGYYIGATVTDDLNQKTTAYSAGRVTVLDRTYFSYSLGQVESLKLGRTLRGSDPNGQLGKVTAHVPWKLVKDPKDPAGNTLRRQPGLSTNGDKYDDFMVTSPTSNPFSGERVGAGESFLISSEPGILFTPPAVGPFDPITITAIGTAKLPGTLFAGPAHTGTTSGIGAVAMSRAVVQDNKPLVVFGIPYVSNLVQEEQDYDPWDQVEYQMMTIAPVHFYTGYKDTYRQPTTANDRNPDGNQTDRAQSGWNNITAGMIVAVSGSNAPIGALPSALPQQTVIPIDNAGQLSADPHPRVVLNNGLPALGTRLYCPWWYDTFTEPLYAGYLWGPIVGGDAGSDQSHYGESVIEADLDGDGYPEWIATRPCDHSSGLVNRGGIDITWSFNTQLWTAGLPGVAGVTKMASTWDVWLTTVTTAAGAPPVVTTTGPTQFAVPGTAVEAVRCWSWPYAVSHGRLNLNLAVDQTVTPNTNTYSKIGIDQRERWWCWPVVSDFLKGEAGDATTGHVSGLGNVGDFNGDNCEDITVGTPNAGPAGFVGEGFVYLIFGRANFGDVDLGTVGTLAPGSLAGIKIMGETAGDLVGSWQGSAGDFNGDGYSDWIIGAPGYNGGRGLAAIIYGNPKLQGIFKLSDIGTAKLPGVKFTGEAAGYHAGASVAGVGDVDGDGFDDVAIVSPQANWTFADATVRTQGGLVYLIYGGKDPITHVDYTGTFTLADVAKGNLPGQIYVGPHNNEPVTTVAPAGDVDGDGKADFLIGNPNYNILDQNGNVILQKVGEVYLIRGAARIVP